MRGRRVGFKSFLISLFLYKFVIVQAFDDELASRRGDNQREINLLEGYGGN